MKFAILLMFSFGLLCCGGQSTQRQQTGDTRVDSKEGGFLARYNPCDCLLHREDLSVEIRVGNRWERIALRDQDQTQRRVPGLLDKMRRQPAMEQRIWGTVTDRLVDWAGGHYARQFLVEDPPSAMTDD
ncbi:MAG: hypothetical protein VX589_17495 [Myxococcota bacterium]|nr:hypothetical protein [Myxococcota bacterium]